MIAHTCVIINALGIYAIATVKVMTIQFNVKFIQMRLGIKRPILAYTGLGCFRMQ